MNNPHKNARMTPLDRAEMVRRIVQEKRPLAEVAAGFGVFERTARKWLARWQAEGAAGLENRSSRPRSPTDDTSGFWRSTAERLRRDYRLTGAEIAEKLSLARSTVAGWLTRMGLGRLSAIVPKEPVRRYQRERPGELVPLDIKKLARFEGVGHRKPARRQRGNGLRLPAHRHRRRHPAGLCRGAAGRTAMVDNRLSCPYAQMVQGARRPGR